MSSLESSDRIPLLPLAQDFFSIYVVLFLPSSLLLSCPAISKAAAAITAHQLSLSLPLASSSYFIAAAAALVSFSSSLERLLTSFLSLSLGLAASGAVAACCVVLLPTREEGSHNNCNYNYNLTVHLGEKVEVCARGSH